MVKVMNEYRCCPFCGNEEIKFYIVNDGGNCPPKGFQEEWAAECDECLAEGPWAKSKLEAVQKWNTRIINQ